ncbi:hypothetical protein SAMN02745119_03064 [Trichlorobacter thiogenes]|uniref:Uncharacterized protein n=1 Tax=Trichlorobacter thiogenes TaxID=115783 RepID=A0A1T4RU53_9BACT|nr:hypothetical protein [Trichlorobacter thiogenes]SKA19131.1 hypothetical protein SAMN02745119_03064 [Trichlorobacter thiogenes]
MDYVCPACKSENIQRLSVIYEAGLSEINTTSSTSGIGGSCGSFGGGVASTSTTGISQTAASQRATPPEKQSYLKPLLAIYILHIVAQVFGPKFWGGHLFTYAWMAVSVLWVCFAFQYNKKTWPPLKAAWDDSYMCNRCNKIFVLIPTAT